MTSKEHQINGVSGIGLPFLFGCFAFLVLFFGGIWITSQSQDMSAEAKKIKVQAEKGDTEAQYQLGRAYYEGKGVKKNPEEAVNWWNKAADKKLGKADLGLAEAYHQGNGAPKDNAEAFMWAMRARANGAQSAEVQPLIAAVKKDMTSTERTKMLNLISLERMQKVRSAN